MGDTSTSDIWRGNSSIAAAFVFFLFILILGFSLYAILIALGAAILIKLLPSLPGLRVHG